MLPSSRDDVRIPRRELLLGASALLLASCRPMAQVKASGILVERPEPDGWQPVLYGLTVTVLPFEHPAFPHVSPPEILAQLRVLFRDDDDPTSGNLPKALMLFDATSLMASPPAPIVDDERRDLAMSRVTDIDRAVDEAFARDRAAWATYETRFGSARFVDQSLDARRAYFSLWGASAFITRRRFYRGVKSLLSIAAYSMKPFWDAVGYEGPLLGHG